MIQPEKDVNISDLLWYKIGGKVAYLFKCKNKEEVLESLKYTQDKDIKKILIVGQGSNLIFAKEYFDGAVIHIKGDKNSFAIEDDTVSCFGGESLDDLIRFCFQNNLTGLEWAGGLPGTVGAGVRGNVGAFGGEIKDTFLSAEVVNIKNLSNVLQYSKEDMHFAYRESKIKDDKDTIVLTAKFILKKAREEELSNAKKIYQKNKEYRQKKHPIEFPNCGSVFKNIVKKEEVEAVFQKWPDVKKQALSDWYGKVSMGYIINRLGFTGKTNGGVQVSEKHSNFIVNKGNATGKEVLQLIEQIKEAVREEFGFTPEAEPEIIV